jgi:hypothetical protein
MGKNLTNDSFVFYRFDLCGLMESNERLKNQGIER